jgi:hypothetical protein
MRCPTARGNAAAQAAPPRSGGWYVRAAVRARSTHALCAVATTALLAAAACGGGERQDANEPSGDFEVEVLNASFPKSQKLGKSAHFEITVRNAGDEAVPNLAVTVSGFGYRREETGLADPSRPRFAVNGLPEQIGGFPEAIEDSPRGCATAYVDTWACGSLEPDSEKTMRWSVTAVVAGPYKVSYRVAAGLNGKAKAVLAGGDSAVQGSFAGTVSDKPNHTRVGSDGKSVVN